MVKSTLKMLILVGIASTLLVGSQAQAMFPAARMATRVLTAKTLLKSLHKTDIRPLWTEALIGANVAGLVSLILLSRITPSQEVLTARKNVEIAKANLDAHIQLEKAMRKQKDAVLDRWIKSEKDLADTRQKIVKECIDDLDKQQKLAKSNRKLSCK